MFLSLKPKFCSLRKSWPAESALTFRRRQIYVVFPQALFFSAVIYIFIRVAGRPTSPLSGLPAVAWPVMGLTVCLCVCVCVTLAGGNSAERALWFRNVAINLASPALTHSLSRLSLVVLGPIGPLHTSFFLIISLWNVNNFHKSWRSSISVYISIFANRWSYQVGAEEVGQRADIWTQWRRTRR